MMYRLWYKLINYIKLSGDYMKLISLNIEFSKHHATVVPFLKKEDPDVVCLQELVEGDVEYFKKELGMECVYKVQDYVHSAGHGGRQDRRYGNAIFTNHVVENWGYSFYSGAQELIDKPFEEYFLDDNFQNNRVLVWADIKDTDGKIFRFATTHFFLTKDGVATPEQLECLNSLFAALDPLTEFVLCGDMNAPRGRETFDRLAQKYKDNIPAIYATSLDMKLHRAAEFVSTYVVDGLFTTPSYEAFDVRLAGDISDHMAIVADISKK